MRDGFIKKLPKQILASFVCVLAILPWQVSVASASNPSPGFTLTAEEQAYLHTLRDRPIIIAYSYDLIQIEFDGKSYGILEPVLDVLRNEFGLAVKVVKTNWHDAFTQVEDEAVDFYGPIAISDSRRQKYITVDPFYRSHSKIMTRVDNPVHSMIGLYNRSIGLLEGSIISRTMQAYLGPTGQTIYFPTMEDMIDGLRTGTIDAFATVDNAEFEILQHDDIQFEFSIDNFFVDQGLISGREDMRLLASLLSRYLKENPQVSDEIVNIRRQALFHYARESFFDEIAYLQANYDEVTLYSDKVLYPLCYSENGVMKGMQVEINDIFEEFTGVKIRFDNDENYPDGAASVLERLKTGECMAFVGAIYNIDIWNDPAIQYSPLLWMETMHTYSNKDLSGNLNGKTLGAMLFSSDYLGWNNMTGNAPVLYTSRNALINALKNGEVDVAFMEEMRFNYNYTILGDYGLREVEGISAQAPMHMLYGAQNEEFNVLFDESMKLFNILNPQSMGQWKVQSDKYKSDYIRIRYTQQIVSTIAIIVFIVMLLALLCLFARNKQAHKCTQNILADVEEKRQTILEGIHYASKIQRNLLPDNNAFEKAFSDYSIIWEPRDIVGGDIYWIKSFDKGCVLCVCDCTGHGTPGALLTMLVVSALEAVAKPNNCCDTAELIWQLEQRLVGVFSVKSEGHKKTDIDIKDGCDLAILFIAKDGNVTLSAGNTNVFVCDGKEARRIKGQKIYVGEGRLNSKDEIKTVHIPANPDNKFYIGSDGLFDQPSDKQPVPFGYKRFGEIILKNHHENQTVISGKIWEAFEAYRGAEPRVDDFELITFTGKDLWE